MSRYKTEDFKAYYRKYYLENKSKKALSLENHRKTKIRKFYDAVGPLKCSRCPESDIACMDFHHRNPAEKSGNVTNMIRCGSLDKAIAEVKKCDVLCSNCHRKLHFYETVCKTG